MYVSASLLSADFSRLGEEVAAAIEAGADLLHIDVMDGHFVPNLTFGPCLIAGLAETQPLPLDIHLMVERPEFFVDLFLPLRPKFLSFHPETSRHPARLCQRIREAGVHPGLVLNPHVPIPSLTHLLDFADLVLLMSVNPGFAGQALLGLIFEKTRLLREEIDRRDLKIFIEIDGGVNGQNAPELAAAGADILVAGSFIFGSRDYAAAISALKSCF